MFHFFRARFSPTWNELNLYNTFQLAKDRIELSNNILGYDISEIMFSAEENVLRQTQYAQPAIFIHSTIIFDLIKDQKECVAVAGHSLGNSVHYMQIISLILKQGYRL